MENYFAVKFLDPTRIISQLDIKKGIAAADFGCGPGYFSIPFSRMVGEEGTLVALDVLPQALEAVESQAKILGIHNITTRRVNLESERGTGLAENSLDLVIAKDVLLQNKKKEKIIQEANRVLKLGGKFLVVEWNDKDESIGPDMSIRIPKKNLMRAVEDAGFSIAKEIEAGDFHYGFLAVK